VATPAPHVAAIADELALAMVVSSDAPLLLLDGDLVVVAASDSFCGAFQVQPADVSGRSFFDIGAGEWNLPKLRSLLTATASGLAAVKDYEIDLSAPGRNMRRLVIKAQKLVYGDPAAPRLLMTICDVTEARLAEKIKDELIREKAVLLQEVQHRVANSLQIIASVLMQSARKVQSEETRRHLKDAHQRVMSIATVQRQLASSHAGDIELRPYFKQLCQSLGASMIRDHNKQSIEVNADDSVVKADISVSLGLIVTELVINALKHAFPDERAGKIIVGYRSEGRNWTLSIEDDGVGMPKGKAPAATPGLGTSLVEALTRQLHATIKVTDRNPGTVVSIIGLDRTSVEDANLSPQQPAI
jgi:two-component sensor histidine kinase